MRKILTSDFSGGLNNANPPDTIADNQLALAENVEYVHSDRLSVRPSVEKISEGVLEGYHSVVDVFLYYPRYMPSDAHEGADHVYIVYGKEADDGSYDKFYMSYTRDGSTFSIVEILEINENLPSVDNLELSFTTDRYGVNVVSENLPAQFIQIDKDGVIRSGRRGLGSPYMLPILDISPEVNSFIPKDSLQSKGMGIPKGSIPMYAYSLVDKYGGRSNPSPLTINTDLNFIERGDDGDTSAYWKKTVITNMKMNGIQPAALNDMDKIEIYRANTLFSENDMPMGAMRKVGEMNISGIENEEVVAYADLSEGIGKYIDYSRALSPVGGGICSSGSNIFVAGGNDGIDSIMGYKYYREITLMNRTARNYVDGKFLIMMDVSDLYVSDPSSPTPIFDASEHIEWDGKTWKYNPPSGGDGGGSDFRFFYSDKTTPLPVACTVGTGHDDQNEKPDVLFFFVSVPYLPASTATTLYLCLGYSNVPQEIANEYEYGYVVDYEPELPDENTEPSEVTRDDRIFKFNRVRNNAVSVCMGNESRVDYETAVNLADTKKDGIGVSSWADTNELSLLTMPINEDLTLDGGRIPKSGISDLVECNPVESGTGTDWITYKLSKTDVPMLRVAGRVYQSLPNGGLTYTLLKIGDLEVKYTRDTNASNGWASLSIGNDVLCSVFVGSYYDYSLYFDINIDFQANKIHTFMYMFENRNSNLVVVNSSDYGQDMQFDKITLRNDNNSSTAFTEWGQVEVWEGDAILSDTMRSYFYMMNGLPRFDSLSELIGVDTKSGLQNHNVSISELKEFGGDLNKRLLTWTKDFSFTKGNYKLTSEDIVKIIPAPSFLKQTYEDTILVFTRNMVSRFIMKGDYESWNAREDNLVSEYYGRGLLAPRSLEIVGNSVFWLSESGIWMWNSEGMRNISTGRIYVPIETSAWGYKVIDKNQYVLVTKGTHFVYDVDGDRFTTFTGDDLIDADRVLYDNYGENIKSPTWFFSSGDKDIFTFSDTREDVVAKVTTKTFDFGTPLQFKRFKMKGVQNTSVIHVESENRFGVAVADVSPDAGTDKNWIWLPNGVWGETISFNIKGSHMPERIEIETRDRR